MYVAIILAVLTIAIMFLSIIASDNFGADYEEGFHL